MHQTETGRPEALTILLREHREMEKHLKSATEWTATLNSEGAGALPRLQEKLVAFAKAVREDLALHIAHEDKALFIVLARYIGKSAGPIAAMLMEHRHLEGSEAKFAEGLSAGDAAAIADAADSIVSVLTGHIWKEENVLFPLAAQTLTPADWDEVLSLIGA